MIDSLDEDGKHWLCGKKASGTIRCGTFREEGSTQWRTECYSAKQVEVNSTRLERIERERYSV